MIIPDCRTDENYNEKYLNERDKAEVFGYDWCTEMVVDNFFDNLDAFFDSDSYLMHTLNEKLPEDMQDTYDWSPTFLYGEDEPSKQERSITNYADLLRSELLDWIESHRDELITSMIDNMDENEYNAIKEKIDGQSKADN